MKIVKKAWGHEIILVSTELYSCKLMVIKGGYQCSIHYHKEKDESFMLLAGDTTLMLDRTFKTLKFLDPIRIHRGTKHSFAGYGLYSVLLEVATQDIAEDSYRETKSGRIE